MSTKEERKELLTKIANPKPLEKIERTEGMSIAGERKALLHRLSNQESPKEGLKTLQQKGRENNFTPLALRGQERESATEINIKHYKEQSNNYSNEANKYDKQIQELKQQKKDNGMFKFYENQKINSQIKDLERKKADALEKKTEYDDRLFKENEQKWKTEKQQREKEKYVQKKYPRERSEREVDRDITRETERRRNSPYGQELLQRQETYKKQQEQAKKEQAKKPEQEKKFKEITKKADEKIQNRASNPTPSKSTINRERERGR